MKTLLLTVSIIGALLAGQIAHADGRYYSRGYDRHSYDYRRGYGYDRYRYRDGYRASRYDRSWRRRGSYRGHSWYPRHYYYPRYHRYYHDSGYFVGGLILGSLLTSDDFYSQRRYRSTYRQAPVVQRRTVATPVLLPGERIAAGSSSVASGRRLLRDLQGNCFERYRDENGREIRVELPRSACRF